MIKKAASFFPLKTLACSLCVLSMTVPSHIAYAQVSPRLDESVTYTMNFRNIAIVEYIRFVARISKINFIFNETDLNFPVTLVSDQPVSAKNLFSALAQVLEVNGFILSDQEGSILITKNPGSSQLAPLNQLQSPLVTRIYKIENINLGTLTQIVKSVVSKGALVESLLETNQLIVTDTGPNLDKLASLINDLDSSGSNLKLMSYSIKNQSAEKLAKTIKEAIGPFQGTNPYLVIALGNSNQLLVVSTPYLIQQTQAVLQALDVAESSTPIDNEAGNIFIYTPKFRKPEDIKTALVVTSDSLADEGPSASSLIAMISSAKIPQGFNTLIFVGNKNVWIKLQEILSSIDTQASTSSLYIYNIQHASADAIESMLEDTASKAESAGDPDGLASAIDTMKYIPSTNSIVFSGSQSAIAQLKSLLPSIDVNSKTQTIGSIFSVYELKNVSGDLIISELKSLEPTFQKQDAQNLILAINNIKWLKSSNSLLITGSQGVVANLEAIIAKLDVSSSTHALDNKNQIDSSIFSVYELKNVGGDLIISELKSLEPTFQKQDAQNLILAINNIKWLKSSNSLLITGSQSVIVNLEAIIAKLDVSSSTHALIGKHGFAIYPLAGTNGEALTQQLHSMADEIDTSTPQGKANKEALSRVKYISETNSLMIFGNQESVSFVEGLVARLDITKAAGAPISFAFYQVKSPDGKNLVEKLQKFAKNLPSQTIQDKAIQDSLKNTKYIAETNSILIQGSQESIAFVQNLAQQIDEGYKVPQGTKFVIYSLKNASGTSVVSQLHEMAEHIPDDSAASEAIKSCLETAKFLPDTNSIMLTGSNEAIQFAEGILTKIDIAPAATDGSTFYLYKLQSQPGNKVIQKVKDFASKLPQTTQADKNIIACIQNLEWIKDNNAILISGSQSTIDRVSSLIAQYDSTAITTDNKGDFLIYTPVNISLEALQESMEEYAVALKQSGLSDPNLIETINTAKAVPSANHLVFTGNADSISKVKSILSLIDQASPQDKVQKLGQMTFLVYQLKSLAPDQFASMMRSFAANMHKSGSQDAAVIKAIDNMQYLKETNSYLFSGPEAALDKVMQIAAKIDVSKAEVSYESNYEIYTPKYQNGSELLSELCQFAKGLSDSGVKDQVLYDTINNIRWIERSNALIITGSPETLVKVQDLLNRFDVPGASKQAQAQATAGFMVYKLQYHAGTEIQAALNKLSSTFVATGPNPNPGLASAISSIQWIQTTNSLVASGDQDSLEKLKSLISEIDVPLKQVFIEVLVVQTNQNNSLNFGLQWFGKGQIKNQLGFGTGNFGGVNPTTQTQNLPNFAGQANNISLSSTPTGNSIPFMSPGFDLGVIGDVLFHKGKSFLSLGSLVNALQADQDSTVVMNPKIISQDNQNSTIFIGQNVPFIGSSVQNSSANTVTSQNIEYRNVGTNLSITPKLGDDNVVTLEITYNMSSVDQQNYNGGSSGGLNGIQTNQTNMTTRVHVPDQHFVVLSGMLQDSREHYKTGIPCLGGLPIIGAAFSDNERSDQKNNILIFIRPCIVQRMDDLKELTEQQENKYRDMLDLQVLKEEFDEGINLVKEPENE